LNERVVGLGEIGLDFVHDRESKAAQIELFEKQLELAEEFKFPVVVHTSGAHQETREAIIRSGAQQTGVIIQGFTGDLSTLQDWLDLGLYISIGPRVLKPGAENLASVVRYIPSENLLIETDAAERRTISQGLELVTLRPIAEKVAQMRNVPLEELARVTTINLKKLFNVKETVTE
jgi:TatD DNase family protein